MHRTEPSRRSRALLAAAVAALVVLLGALAGIGPAGAAAGAGDAAGGASGTGGSTTTPPATPQAGDPWIISLGDSYISGEGGRWAGNADSLPESATDALGPTAYFDNPTDTGELIPYCHRSKSAEVHIRDAGALPGFNTLNLACSGAETSTYWSGTLSNVFKPGIDFYDDGQGHQGQAKMLQEAANGKDVGMVVLSIGGNDFDVSGAAETCVEDFLESNWFSSYYCSTDSSVTGRFAPDAAKAVQDKIVGAIANIRSAMTAAGHGPDDYTLVVQTYPQPIPYGSQFRYSQSGYTRESTGGCGFWDVDANWMVNDALGVVNATVRQAIDQAGGDILTLELTHLMVGRQLCQDGVGLLEEEDLTSWTDPGAVDVTEWLNQIHINTVDSDHFIQESLHPNYWAQLALRSCLRQVWNDGSPRGGTCVHGTGLDADGEPNVALHGPTLNDLPLSGADRYTSGTGPLEVPAPGVLANDHDPGSVATAAGELPDLRIVPPADGVTARLVSSPANGDVQLRADGSFTYAPRAGFTGTDTFTYQAADAFATGAVTVVEIVVTPGAEPVAIAPRFTG